MTEQPEAPGHEPGNLPDEEVPPPVGTIFILTIYLMVMAGMWGAIYLVLLNR